MRVWPPPIRAWSIIVRRCWLFGQSVCDCFRRTYGVRVKLKLKMTCVSNWLRRKQGDIRRLPWLAFIHICLGAQPAIDRLRRVQMLPDWTRMRMVLPQSRASLKPFGAVIGNMGSISNRLSWLPGLFSGLTSLARGLITMPTESWSSPGRS